MKTAIVGPGAIGCLFGALLGEGGAKAVLLDKNAERAAQINKSGIRVEGIGGDRRVGVEAVADPKKIGIADLVLICVKSPDTRAAAQAAKSLVSENTTVMTLQNGLGNVEALAEIFGQARVVGGTTALGATMLGAGRIRHAGNGETVVGEIDGNISMRLAEIKSLFSSCGIKTQTTDNLEGLLWSKLIINVGINALTGICRVKNGKLIEYAGSREVLRAAVSEAVDIAKKAGVKLLYDDPVAKVESVCVATSANISSMFQDVLKKRKTEIDFINGAIVKKARELGLNAPVNETLANLVSAIHESYGDTINSL